MELRTITCPACGGRNFTVEEVVEDDELNGVDLRCARGCGFYTYEAGDRSAWCGIDSRVAAVQPLACGGRPRPPRRWCVRAPVRQVRRAGGRRTEEGIVMPTPNEYPATVECPQCGHEVGTTLYVYQDVSGAYVFGKHCSECDEAVAMDMRLVIPGVARWSGLYAWLTGERFALEARMKRMAPDAATYMRLRGRLDEVVMALQRMDDLEKAVPPGSETS